jgi:hypothetical protein
MAILNAMLSGGTRAQNDAYPTPGSATLALIPYIQEWKGAPIWECACGSGAISKRLLENSFQVISSDLYDYGFGRTGFNFLKEEPLASTIITNPPFNLSAKFIERAIANKTERMALLLKSNYWHVAKRIKLFHRWRPKLILAFTWRLDFTGAGAPHTDCSWIIWEGQSNQTQFELLVQ